MGGGQSSRAELWGTRIATSVMMALFISFLVLPFAKGDQVIEYIQKGAAKSGSAQKKKCATDQKRDEHGNVLCRYYQANDNLTLQALYLTEKLKRVDDAIQAKDEAKAQTALGAFCRSGESATDCFPRYKSFQALALTRIRQAIGTNEDSIARLTTGRQDDGSARAGAHQVESEMTRETYVPDIPRMSDLENEFRQSGRIVQAKKVTHGEVLKWSQELVNPDPKTKFHEFKSAKVKANPHQAGSTEMLNMLERDPAGELKLDQQVDQFASKKRQDLQKEIASADKSDHSYEVETYSPGELKTKDELSYEAILEARGQMIGKVNSELAKKSGTALPGGAQNTSAVEIRNGAVGAINAVGDEDKVLVPPTNTTHTYIKYDLNTLFEEIGALTQ